jgi:hypothetical protein
MVQDCDTTELNSIKEIFDVLIELRGKRWLCRGHSKVHGCLIPSIERKLLKGKPRHEILQIERRVTSNDSTGDVFCSVLPSFM